MEGLINFLFDYPVSAGVKNYELVFQGIWCHFFEELLQYAVGGL